MADDMTLGVSSELPTLVPTPRASTEGPIAPIETRYAGHRFRSRLEARWAVFFDQMGIRWEYEPDCYRIAGKGYLPDFWLPDLAVWVEVKGVLDEPTLMHLVQAASPHGLPAAPTGDRWEPGLVTGRIILLGAIPKAAPAAWLHTRLDVINGQVAGRKAHFLTWGDDGGRATPLGDGWPLFDAAGYPIYSSDENRALILAGQRSCILRSDFRVEAAYRAARMARFEHGESGYSEQPALDAPVIHQARPVAPQSATRTSPPPKHCALHTASLRSRWLHWRTAFINDHPEAREALSMVADIRYRMGKATIFSNLDAEAVMSEPWFVDLQQVIRQATGTKVKLTCMREDTTQSVPALEVVEPSTRSELVGVEIYRPKPSRRRR